MHFLTVGTIYSHWGDVWSASLHKDSCKESYTHVAVWLLNKLGAVEKSYPERGFWEGIEITRWKMWPVSYKNHAGQKWHLCLVSFNLITQFIISSSTICWPPIKSHRVSPQQRKNRQISFSTVRPGGQNSSFAFACSLIHFLIWLPDPYQSHIVLSDKSGQKLPLRCHWNETSLSKWFWVGEYTVEFAF